MLLKNKKYSSKLQPSMYIKLSTMLNHFGPVWYTCLKTENCCLKIFVEIRVGEKVYGNM